MILSVHPFPEACESSFPFSSVVSPFCWNWFICLKTDVLFFFLLKPCLQTIYTLPQISNPFTKPFLVELPVKGGRGLLFFVFQPCHMWKQMLLPRDIPSIGAKNWVWIQPPLKVITATRVGQNFPSLTDHPYHQAKPMPPRDMKERTLRWTSKRLKDSFQSPEDS